MIIKRGKQCDLLILVLHVILLFSQDVRSQAPPADSDSKSTRIQELIAKETWNILSAPSRWLSRYLNPGGGSEVTEIMAGTTEAPSLIRSLFSIWYPREEHTTTSRPTVVRGDGAQPKVKKGSKQSVNKSKPLKEQMGSNERKRKALRVKVKQLQKDVNGAEGASDRNRLRKNELQDEAKKLITERTRLKEQIAEQNGETSQEKSPNPEAHDGDDLSERKKERRRRRGRLATLTGTSEAPSANVDSAPAASNARERKYKRRQYFSTSKPSSVVVKSENTRTESGSSKLGNTEKDTTTLPHSMQKE